MASIGRGRLGRNANSAHIGEQVDLIVRHGNEFVKNGRLEKSTVVFDFRVMDRVS